MGEGLGGRNLKPNSEALNLDAGTERMKALMSGTHGIPSGGGGCASHVPARCRGEAKSPSKCRSVFRIQKCASVVPTSRDLDLDEPT